MTRTGHEANEALVKRSNPRVLLVSLFRWISLARAAIAFHEAGFSVSVLVPHSHPAEKLSCITSSHAFNVFSAEMDLVAAIRDVRPSLLIPFDDVVVPVLHSLYIKRGSGDDIGFLIARSLGDPASYRVTRSRLDFAKTLAEIGVASPATLAVSSEADLAVAQSRLDLPFVLKRDGSWGGQGVAIIRKQGEAHSAFARLLRRRAVPRAVKRAIVNRDNTGLHALLHRIPKAMVAQHFIAGRSANAAVACWQGEVLGSVYLEVLQSAGETGPATVVRLFDSPAMTKAVAVVVKHLKLSGICGFDFILNGLDDQPYMIEMNPRAVPTLHLVNAMGWKLCELLHVKMTGYTDGTSVTEPQRGVIALFPQEMLRDPHSPYFSTAFHDVPTQWPEFVELALGKQPEQRRFAPAIPRKA